MRLLGAVALNHQFQLHTRLLLWKAGTTNRLALSPVTLGAIALCSCLLTPSTCLTSLLQGPLTKCEFDFLALVITRELRPSPVHHTPTGLLQLLTPATVCALYT